MKKIISFILILIVCLSVPQLAYAEETPIRNNISFSDSLTEIKDKETLKLSKKDSDKSHLSYEGKIDGYTSFIDYYFNDKGNLSDIIYKTVFNDGYNVRASNTAPRELYDFYYNLFDKQYDRVDIEEIYGDIQKITVFPGAAYEQYQSYLYLELFGLLEGVYIQDISQWNYEDDAGVIIIDLIKVGYGKPKSIYKANSDIIVSWSLVDVDS